MISTSRTSDFQISGSAISSHKNIHFLNHITFAYKTLLNYWKAHETSLYYTLNITLRRSRLSGVARATFPDKQSHLVINYCIMF